MNRSPIKVLFVSSDKQGRPGDVVYRQGESLRKVGIDPEYLLIRPGLAGYLAAVPAIRKAWGTGKYSLVHAHYSLSGFAASLAGRFPLVVSLMGSDVFMLRPLRIVSGFMARRRWARTIVKSEQMRELLDLPVADVIPNGVDTELFRPMPKDEARRLLGYPAGHKLIVFISAPGRPEKNYELALEGVKRAGDPGIELRRLYGLSPEIICRWLNAADLMLLTSKWEGSPNVIKEAMACNCPIVFTDAGDALRVAGDTAGCFLTSDDPVDVAGRIRDAIAFNARTDGRSRIFALKLDSVTVAENIRSLYEEVIAGR